MSTEIVRKEEEVDDLLNKCSDQINDGGSKYPGMTYEQGIEAAIRWLTDDQWENPLE
jgi:predicted secreted Zn-dependent protease